MFFLSWLLQKIQYSRYLLGQWHFNCIQINKQNLSGFGMWVYRNMGDLMWLCILQTAFHNHEIFRIVKSFTPVLHSTVWPKFTDQIPFYLNFIFIYYLGSRCSFTCFYFSIPLLSAASQMVVADLSEPEKRADALSKLGLCFGVGMIAGSTLGGHLNTRYGWVSLCVCCCVFVLGAGE